MNEAGRNRDAAGDREESAEILPDGEDLQRMSVSWWTVWLPDLLAVQVEVGRNKCE